MTLVEAIPSSCTVEEAVPIIAELSMQLRIDGKPPDVRTLRLWRTKKYLTIAGRHLTARNVLEALAIHKLRQEGVTVQHAARRTLALDEDRLHVLLRGPVVVPVARVDAEPLITLQLLATGIIHQYRRVATGGIVGRINDRNPGIDGTPMSLQQAMARLGRHYFTEGMEDRASSVHQLLCLCMTPLASWAPRALAALESYGDVVLIDPEYRVPNEDCEAIAEEADGANLSDLIERHLHESLLVTLSKLGNDADATYTIVREFIGRHPLATRTDLQHLYVNPELNNEVIDFVRGLYVPVHASYAGSGTVRRCAHCNSLLDTDGFCVLAGCRDDHPISQRDGVTVAASDAFLARPEILKFWADPAREELRLYDALRANRQIQHAVQLYPYSDRCDIAIGDDVGVDVKDYGNPVRLASRLNRSLGGLQHYSERILAIAQRRWSTVYRERLIEQLNPERRATLQVMSVDEALSYLMNSAAGGNRAY